MERYESLTHILRSASEKPREIRFIDGEKDEVAVAYRDIWREALSLLGSMLSVAVV